MEFNFSSIQASLQDNVRRFCREHYSSGKRTTLLESSEGFSQQNWRRFGELGWLGVALPSDVNGSGATAVESSIILQEFGRVLVVEPYWSCALMAGHLIDHCRSAHQRVDLLTKLVSGDIFIAVAHSEAQATCFEYVETRATISPGGGFVITGRKPMVMGGAAADKFIVSARTRGEIHDREGISLFVIDRNSEGLSCNNYRLLDGTPACDLELMNARVDSQALLGDKDLAIGAIDHATDHGIVGLCAEMLGIIDSVLWLTRDYLRLRRQYGVTLNTFQALQHRMADMFVEVELSRSILFRALSVLGKRDSATRRAGALAAHIHLCRSGEFVCKNGIQLHGALGMTEEHMVGQYFKRIAVLSGLFGGVDLQLTRFANQPG